MANEDNQGFAPALGDQGTYAADTSSREPTQPPGPASTTGGDFLPGPPDPAAPASAPPDPGTTDWSSILGIYGMPPDIAAAVGKIFAQYSDPNQAVLVALAYIRGTAWYAATYPGIQAGMANGLTRNEADYRAYVNEINQYYKQYYGRDATAQEITDFLTNGTSAPIVGKTLEGNSYAAAYKSDIEFYAGNFGTGQLTQDQLNQYGQEKVGLGSDAGYKIQRMIDDAVKRYQGAFGGQLAKPQEALGPVGLVQQGLAGQQESLSKGPDIGAG